MKFIRALALVLSFDHLCQSRAAANTYDLDVSKLLERELAELYYRDVFDLYPRQLPELDTFKVIERDVDDFELWERDIDDFELQAREAELDYLDHVRRIAHIGRADFVKRASSKPTAGEPTKRKTDRFLRVQAAIKGLKVENGKHAFYRIWPAKDQGPRHKDLNKLIKEIGGLHYTLVVGTLSNNDFTGVAGDMRFVEKLEKTNGNGQTVATLVQEYTTDKDDQTSLRYLGKVSRVDRATVEAYAKKALVNKTYNVQNNNCKTYVDKLYSILKN